VIQLKINEVYIVNSEEMSVPLIISHIDLNFVNLRLDYLRSRLEKIACMGYNAVLWELEDKIEWESCPECVHPEAMSKMQFRELLNYARSLGLEPIPLLQTIGHAEYVLSQPRYHAWREVPNRHDCYCTSAAEVRHFLAGWVQEYRDLFGELRFFHLGGDEAFVFGSCPECRAKIAATSASALYAEHLTAIAAPLISDGIRPGFWSDMLLHYPTERVTLPSAFVVWDWNYWDGCGPPERTMVWQHKRFVEKDTITCDPQQAMLPNLCDATGALRPFHTVDTLQQYGFDIILCSASRAYGDSFFTPFVSQRIDNIAGAASKAKSADLMGICVTSWALRLNRYETQDLFSALAPAIMKSEQPVAEITSRIVPESLISCLAQIGTLILDYNLFSAVHWNGLKDSTPAPAGHVASTLADFVARQPESWSNRFDLLDATLAAITAGLEALGRQETTETSIAWREAGLLQLRFYQALKMMIGATPDFAASYAAMSALRKDYGWYLAQVQTPINANYCAGLVFDPLLEYLDRARRIHRISAEIAGV